jgi:hypothetical protein
MFSRPGVFASKRGGGRGRHNFDGQIDGQMMGIQKNDLPEKNPEK